MADGGKLAQARLGIGEVQNHERASHPGAGEHAHYQPRAALGQDADDLAGPAFASFEPGRQIAGQCIELTVGDRPVFAGNRQRIGPRQGPSLEPCVDKSAVLHRDTALHSGASAATFGPLAPYGSDLSKKRAQREAGAIKRRIIFVI